jgi:hypothetical protein
MPVNESSATALVRFTGLGIICFNKDRKRGEIGAIRDDKHKLSVKIQKPVFQEGVDKDIITYQDIASYAKLPKDDVQIEIKAAGESAIEGYETYQSGDFDRLASADVNDFRWIVNMNALHGETALEPTAAGKHPLAKIYIGNGLFYAHKLDRNLFFERVEKNAGGTPLQRETFGNVAETIGVKIEGDEVIFAIRVAGKEETHSLPRVAGFPYRIEIRNVDPNSNEIYSDMPDYYQYLSSPAGNQFDLNPIIEEQADKTVAADSVDQKVFCHPIALDDLSSIDDL